MVNRIGESTHHHQQPERCTFTQDSLKELGLRGVKTAEDAEQLLRPDVAEQVAPLLRQMEAELDPKTRGLIQGALEEILSEIDRQTPDFIEDGQYGENQPFSDARRDA